MASTPYKKVKTDRLDQTHHEDQTSSPGATDATDAIVLPQGPSPSPMAQLPMMNAGPFAALMNVFMQGMQHMSGPNTGGQFKSRLPLQLATFKKELSDQPADGGASPAEEVKHDNSEDDDELANLEADFAIAKKEAARVKSDIAKAAQAKAKAAAAKAKGKAAAPKAKGKAGAPITKENVKRERESGGAKSKRESGGTKRERESGSGSGSGATRRIPYRRLDCNAHYSGRG